MVDNSFDVWIWFASVLLSIFESMFIKDIGKHFYMIVGFGGGQCFNFSYCMYFCDEIWACEFLLLVVCLIWMEQVGAENRIHRSGCA